MISVWKIQGLLVLHFAVLNYTLLCCCLPRRMLFILLRKFCIGRCVPGHAGDHICDIVCDNWKALRHSLRVLILWLLGVVWFFLLYFPGLYSSKLSFWGFWGLCVCVSEDSSAQATEVFCSDCEWLGFSLLYMPLLPGHSCLCADYWCESGCSSWTWLLKTCCTGKVAQKAVECVHTSPTRCSLLFQRPC